MQRFIPSRSFTLYLAALFFVCSWWALAFPSKNPLNNLSPVFPKSFSSKNELKGLSELLSPINRDLLQTALMGNVELMTQLMAMWDLEAELLESQGIENIQRLERNLFLHGQSIGRYLQTHKRSSPQPKLSRFLPQTHVAASLLLALVDPEELVAIPRGIRECKELYPLQLTRQIQQDIEYCSSEQLFELHPSIAFVANYSNPATVNLLHNQGVSLEYLNDVDSLEGLLSSLTQLGNTIERPLRAELLSLFVRSAIESIDNRLLALRSLNPEAPPPRVLYLNYQNLFNTPTQATFIGKMLDRLGINQGFDLLSDYDTASTWRIPLDHEMISTLQPDCLIIATNPNPTALHSILHQPVLMELPAMQENKLFFVDDRIQQSPTQWIVLAYYDLYQALLAAEGA